MITRCKCFRSDLVIIVCRLQIHKWCQSPRVFVGLFSLAWPNQFFALWSPRKRILPPAKIGKRVDTLFSDFAFPQQLCSDYICPNRNFPSAARCCFPTLMFANHVTGLEKSFFFLKLFFRVSGLFHLPCFLNYLMREAFLQKKSRPLSHSEKLFKSFFLVLKTHFCLRLSGMGRN